MKGVKQFSDLLNRMGLDLKDSNGGQFIPAEMQSIHSRFRGYDVYITGHGKIPVLDGKFFMSTLRLTENSLRVKLFV